MRGRLVGGLLAPALALALALAPACSVLVDTSDLESGAADVPDAAASAADAALDAAADAPTPPPVADAAVDAPGPPSDAALDADAAPRPKLATFTESFDDDMLHASRWVRTQSTDYTVAAVNQHLEITNSVSKTATGYIDSVGIFDAVGSQLVVDVVQAGNAATSPDVFVWIKLWVADGSASADDAVEIGVESGKLYAKHFVGVTSTIVKLLAYDATTMRSLRIRESGGSTFWDYASSAAGPWTSLYSEPNAIPLSGVSIELGAGAFPGIAGTVIIDNVNTP